MAALFAHARVRAQLSHVFRPLTLACPLMFVALAGLVAKPVIAGILP